MTKKLKLIIGGLVFAVLILYLSLWLYGADRPKAKPDESSARSIQVEKKIITIDTKECTSDLRRVESPRSAWIIEVAGKEFDVCLINYGEATHDRNLNQKLSTRCAIPAERETVSFEIQPRGIVFDSIKQYCK